MDAENPNRLKWNDAIKVYWLFAKSIFLRKNNYDIVISHRYKP